MAFDNCGFVEQREGNVGYDQHVLVFIQEWTEDELREMGILDLDTQPSSVEDKFQDATAFLPDRRHYDLLQRVVSSYVSLALQSLDVCSADHVTVCTDEEQKFCVRLVHSTNTEVVPTVFRRDHEDDHEDDPEQDKEGKRESIPV